MNYSVPWSPRSRGAVDREELPSRIVGATILEEGGGSVTPVLFARAVRSCGSPRSGKSRVALATVDCLCITLVRFGSELRMIRTCLVVSEQ